MGWPLCFRALAGLAIGKTESMGDEVVIGFFR